MKNKTIQILTWGRHLVPVDTIVTAHNINGKSISTWTTEHVEWLPVAHNEDGFYYEVDFSNLPPLLPTPKLNVPEEGIGFTCGKCILLGVSNYGYHNGTCDISTWKTVELKDNSTFELVRTLPKTIQACADCFKEACECKHEDGWYRVKYGDSWALRFWDDDEFRFHEEGGVIHNWRGIYDDVDWSNPISVTPKES